MEVVSIEYIGSTEKNEYVYDLETEEGTYLAGDNILLKNTDSCYVKFDIDKGRFVSELGSFDETAFMKEQFRIAQECAVRISQTFKNPIELAFEKFMYPFFLYEKKRYAYQEWTEPEGPHEHLEYKGVATVRRDYCPYVKEVCNMLFEILMKGHDESSIDRAVEYVKLSIKNMFDDKVPIEKLIISKSLKNTYKVKGLDIKWTHGLCEKHNLEKEEGLKCHSCPTCSKFDKECRECSDAFNKVKSPHVHIAKVLKKIDPVNYPRPPDRVPYVFIVNKKAEHQCDRVAHPNYIGSNKIDSIYYFEHQLKEPILQIFELMMGEKASEIYSALVLEKINKMNKQPQITNFFKKKTEEETVAPPSVSNITTNDNIKFSDVNILEEEYSDEEI